MNLSLDSSFKILMFWRGYSKLSLLVCERNGYQSARRSKDVAQDPRVSLLRLADQTFTWLYPLRPLSPATVIQSSLFCWKAGFGQSCVNDCRCDTGTAAGDNGLRGVDVLGLEHFL